MLLVVHQLREGSQAHSRRGEVCFVWVSGRKNPRPSVRCLVVLPSSGLSPLYQSAVLLSQTGSPSNSSSKLVLHLGFTSPASSCMTSSASVSISPSGSPSNVIGSNKWSTDVGVGISPGPGILFLLREGQPPRMRYTPAKKPLTIELRKPEPLAALDFDAAATDWMLVETSQNTIITYATTKIWKRH